MSIRPVKRIVSVQAHDRGRRRASAPRLRLRRHHRVRSVPAARRFPQRPARPTTCAGFPWHPHRGIETITYVLAGNVEHGDSLGNRGNLGAGDVQWMTAGRGILHQEMPQGDAQGRMHGFQLWANLPSSLKMTAPRYQDIKAAEIPEVDRRRRHARARGLRRFLGQARPGRRRRRRPALSRRLGAGRASARRCRSSSSATPSPTCSRAPAPSATPRSHSAC